MNKLINLTGQKFGKLFVIEHIDKSEGSLWRCKCDCGNEKLIRSASLRYGKTQSCGCIKPPVDLTNQTIGFWTVIERAYRINGIQYWKCKCKCGTERIVDGGNLVQELTKSCGCYKSQVTIERNYRHGFAKTRLYREWANVKARTLNINNTRYKDYGAKGITICEEWKNDFTAFSEWALSHGYDDSLTIDRIDNNKGYSPDNCRWVDRTVQANNKTNNLYVTINDETHTMAEWCRITGTSKSTAYYRKNNGLPPEQWFNLNIQNQNDYRLAEL